jgi:hypothetical protein
MLRELPPACQCAAHLWLTASGMGKLVDIAPTRDARIGSRATGRAAEVEGRGATAKAAAALGAECAGAGALKFGGGSCCVAFMLVVYLQSVEAGLGAPVKRLPAGTHMSRCFFSAASLESTDIKDSGLVSAGE